MTISQDWWDRWWKEDFSWEGLAKRDWKGWVVDVANNEGVYEAGKVPHGTTTRRATLQDYWRDQEDDLIPSPDGNTRFTRIHLPLEWRDGTSTGKAKWAADVFYAVIADRLGKAGDTQFDDFGNVGGTDRRAQLQGAIFLTFSIRDLTDRSLETSSSRDLAARIPLSARFDTVAFVGDAIFERASFIGPANFRNAAFSRSAWFVFSAFSGNADFDNSAFSERVCFNNATFSKDATFVSTTFLADAQFDGASFSGAARFNNAAFFGIAWFDSAHFVGHVYSGDASFENVVFNGYVSFEDTAFCEGAVFERAIFSKPADFSGRGEPLETLAVNQSLRLNVSRPAEADDIAGLDGLVLSGRLTEESQTLPRARQVFRRLNLSGAVFLDSVDFSNRDILRPSTFKGARFYRYAAFQGSRLHQGVSFLNSEFYYALDPDKTPNLTEWEMSRLWSVELRRLAFTGEIHISEADWRKAFQEQQAGRALAMAKANNSKAMAAAWIEEQAKKKWERTEFNEAVFNTHFPARRLKERESYFSDLEACFRTLKLYMENIQRNRLEEGRFFKLELQARRRRRWPAVPWWERIMSDIYGRVSDYGNSVVRPLGWVVALICAFAVWYALAGNLFLRAPSGDDWWQAFSYSTGRVLPFGPWADEPAAGTLMGRLFNIKDGYGSGVAFGFRLLATFQSLIAIILVFLSGLAVRRRFQIS